MITITKQLLPTTKHTKITKDAQRRFKDNSKQSPAGRSLQARGPAVPGSPSTVDPGRPGSRHSSADGRSGGLSHGRACLRELAVLGGWILRNDVSLLILLDDNYNLAATANHKGTKDAHDDICY
ncbi:MAG: hypothetical protein PHS80_00940 [Methanothrix sp.]|nr:hypothetical protein [Methanothrix sp.]MDD4446142.1 hypothetical protein [Methanothrix sp.]